ncbi:hypothetical protein D3C87_1238760 [compost metagenome]
MRNRPPTRPANWPARHFRRQTVKSAALLALDQSPGFAGTLAAPQDFVETADDVPANRFHATSRPCLSGTLERRRTSAHACTSPTADRGSRSPSPRRSGNRGSSTAAVFPVRPWRPCRRSATDRRTRRSPHRRLRSATTAPATVAPRHLAAIAAKHGCRFPGTCARKRADHRPTNAPPTHARPPVAGPVARSRRCHRSCRPRCKKCPSACFFSFEAFQAFQVPVGKNRNCPHKLPRAEEPTTINLRATIATRPRPTARRQSCPTVPIRVVRCRSSSTPCN